MFESVGGQAAVRRTWRDSAVLKVIGVGFLMLLMLIPLSMVRGLILERQGRQREVEAGIAQVWGGPQTLGGPVLAVRFQVSVPGPKGKPVIYDRLGYFLPHTLAIDGQVDTETRSRGIFDVVVWRTDLLVRGDFGSLDVSSLVGPGESLAAVDWSSATLSVGLSNLRPVRGPLVLDWGGRRSAFAPVVRSEMWNDTAVEAAASISDAGRNKGLPFSFRIGLAGTGRLHVLPVGRTTVVALRSSWSSPGFTGAFLPEASRIGKDGFRARWNVSSFGRGYPEQWCAADVEKIASPLAASSLGVDFVQPADVYAQTERSVKYGALFLVLTFVAFFLFEVFLPFRIHPVQYLLVGSAISLFYLLLLSIAEQLPFGSAYAIASAGIVALLGSYATAVLRGRARGLIFSTVLAGLYGYLYVLLQAEDYALLLGTLGLFAILAVVMYVTRRVNWYGEAPAQAG